MTEQQFNKTNPRRKSGGDRGRGSSAGKKTGNESGGVVNKFTPFQQAEHPAGAGPAHLGELLFLQAQGGGGQLAAGGIKIVQHKGEGLRQLIAQLRRAENQAQFLPVIPQHRLGRFLPAAHEAARGDIPAAGISVFPELPPLNQQLSPGTEQA